MLRIKPNYPNYPTLIILSRQWKARAGRGAFLFLCLPMPNVTRPAIGSPTFASARPEAEGKRNYMYLPVVDGCGLVVWNWGVDSVEWV